MSNDRRFGFFLLAINVIYCFGLAIYFAGPVVEIPVVFLVVAGFLGLLGFSLIVSDVIEHSMNLDDEFHEFASLVADDIAALKSGRITLAHLKLLVLVVGLFIYITQIFQLHKWLAFWHIGGPVNVLLIAVLVMATTFFFGLKLDWFHYRRLRTPWWVFIVPVIGFILSGWLGQTLAEPLEELGATPVSQIATAEDYEDNYRWEHRGSSRVQIFNNYYYTSTSNDGSTSGSVGFTMPKCSGKNCGYFYIFIALVIVVIMVVLASALVTHFWVVGQALLLAIIALIAFRELLFRDYRE